MQIPCLNDCDKAARLRKKAYRGSTLIVTLSVMLILIAFLGVGVFVGVQAYLQGELQKAANAAVMVGAAEMFQSTGGALPTRDTGRGESAARQTFDAIVQNSTSLRGFNARITGGPTVNAGDNSVRMNVAGSISTPFLATAGIKQIDMTVQAKAQSLQLRPTDLQGQGIYIRTTGWPTINTQSAFQRTVTNFPIVDRTGNDVYVKQGGVRKGYQVEACTESDCYDLGPGAVAVGGGNPWPQPANKSIVQGDVLIDLAKAGVKKATSIKISDDGRFYQIAGDHRYINTQNDDLAIESISIFGYSALCPTTQRCISAPLGYARY